MPNYFHHEIGKSGPGPAALLEKSPMRNWRPVPFLRNNPKQIGDRQNWYLKLDFVPCCSCTFQSAISVVTDFVGQELCIGHILSLLQKPPVFGQHRLAYFPAREHLGDQERYAQAVTELKRHAWPNRTHGHREEVRGTGGSVLMDANGRQFFWVVS